MSLLLIGTGASTGGKIQVVTSAAVTVDVHASYMAYDSNDGSVVPGTQNTAISTATTTDVVGVPGSATKTRNVKLLNIRNKHASSATDVTVQHTDGTTTVELFKTTLQAGEHIEFLEDVGFFKVASGVNDAIYGDLTADQSIGSSVTNYINGSDMKIPVALWVGLQFIWELQGFKSAAATAAASLDVRVGTGGTTSDTSRLTSTTGTQTAVLDNFYYWITATVRSVGASGVVEFNSTLMHGLASTGWDSQQFRYNAGTATFDNTVANLIFGLSMSTGASHAITIQSVKRFIVK
jgi:hypothetical protein